MLLAICSTVAALACHDVERPVDGPGQDVPVAQQQGPTAISSLTCTFTRELTAISCQPSSAGGKSVSASVIYGTGSPGTAQYGIFYAVNLVKNLTTQKWSFTAYVQNLLKQSIGTLNGTSVTGVKVFVTDFHATAGTGTVSVANPDGTGTFTAPNQPYFNYNSIVTPSGYTANKVWQFNVPNTVTAVSMSILISTDFPAEQSVALQPPPVLPAWYYNDSSWTNNGVGARAFLKRTMSVLFRVGTSLADRQLAVAFVGGSLVGGAPLPGGDGFYVITVPDDGTGTQLNAAVERIKTLPQVEGAAIQHRVTGSYLKPDDGIGWNQWSLNPDSVSAGRTWALEAVDAPFAWGCSTGDPNVKVGVIDEGFDNTEVSDNVRAGTDAYDAIAQSRHGSIVSSILAAPGDNKKGMTGAMWHAGLYLSSWTTQTDGGVTWAPHIRIAQLIAAQAAQGVRVINLSIARADWDLPIAGLDSTMAEYDYSQVIKPTLLRVATLPLFVIAAGNSRVSSMHSTFPLIRRDFPLNALVVGGSGRDGNAWEQTSNSGTNWGPLIDIYAPAQGMSGLRHLNGQDVVVDGLDGTSLAAPLVTATAGLLLSFDSRLAVTDLRDLIVGGSQDAKRVVHDQGGSNVPRLDMFYALKRAANRPGAPLCGNHVWIANGQVIAQRGTSTEVLGQTAIPHGWGANVLHGGHRIKYFDSTSVYTLDYGSPNWVAGPTAGIRDSVSGGTYLSMRMMSHGGDTAVLVSGAETINNAAGVPVERILIQMTDTHGGPERDTLIDRPVGPTGPLQGGGTCTGGPIHCNFPNQAGTFSALGAFSPRSRRFLIVVNRDTTSITIIPPGGGSLHHDLGPLIIGTPANSARYVYTPEKAEIFEVTINSQAPWFTIVQRPSIPNAFVYWVGISEADSETVAGIGVETVTNTFNTNPETYSRVINSCGIEYRNGVLAVLSGGPAPVSTTDACEDPNGGSFFGGGSIAPLIAQSPPQARLRSLPLLPSARP